MKEKLVGLLDCNNFFVSCERIFRPDLRGKPVLVLSSNDGCVVARSKEVKDMGIPMGVPYFKVKDIVKKEGIVTFSSHLALYRDISRRVFAVMKEELDLIEQYSVDEAFFEIDEGSELVVSRVREAIETKVGIPVSIGVSDTKTKAKYANLIAKNTGGICILTEEKWVCEMPNINLSQIWGVGSRLSMKYRKHGVNTVKDFAALNKSIVANLFGINGIRLYEELSVQGRFVLKEEVKPQQSILSSRSFADELSSQSALEDAVAFHVRQVAADLRRMDMETPRIRVFLGTNRYGDFLLRGGSREAVLTVPTSDTISLLQVANDLFRDIFEPGVPYKKAGVSLTNLKPATQNQKGLFVDYEEGDSPALMKAIDGINTKSGKELVVVGSRVKNRIWKTRNSALSPSYTTKWKDIVEVKAG